MGIKPFCLKPLLLCMFAIMVFWPVKPVDAALVGHESFEYAVGNPLHLKGGGSFPDSWKDNKYWIPGFEGSNEGLTYPGLVTSGNAALNAGSGSDYRLNRPIGREWTTHENDDLWISFLLRVDDATPHTGEFAGIVLARPSVVGSVFMGMTDTRNIGFSVQQHDNFYVTHKEGYDDDAAVTGQTHLILAHLVFYENAADTLELWVDPVLGKLDAPDDSYSNARMVVSQIDIRAGYLEGGVLIDEIRIGDSSTDVLALVPIPGAFWLLGMGILGIFGLRRGRRS